MELVELSSRCAEALRKGDWSTLEQLSLKILISLHKNKSGTDSDIRRVARHYLCAIIGDGEYLLKKEDSGRAHFDAGADILYRFLKFEAPNLVPTLSQEIRDLQQLQLFLTQDRSDTRNKAASSLRRLGRPNLAIDLTSVEINKSRLNYYARVIRGSAEVDLGLFDEAIEDAEIALKHSLPKNRYYPLIVLARAKIGNCKKYGLRSDGEDAIQLALEALRLDESIYTVKVFTSAVRTLGSEEYADLIHDLEAKNYRLMNSPDNLAIQIAESVLTQVDDEMVPDEGLEWLNDPDALDNSNDDIFLNDVEPMSDYYEDYFQEYSDSLDDPQRPHLEP